MASDERGTIAVLDAGRAIFKTGIESHQGRVIDMAGDSVLASFETAIGAVTAALQIQEKLNASACGPSRRSSDALSYRRACRRHHRKDDDTIYGDGVIEACMRRLRGSGEGALTSVRPLDILPARRAPWDSPTPGDEHEEQVGRPRGGADVDRVAHAAGLGANALRHPEHGRPARRQHERQGGALLHRHDGPRLQDPAADARSEQPQLSARHGAARRHAAAGRCRRQLHHRPDPCARARDHRQGRRSEGHHHLVHDLVEGEHDLQPRPDPRRCAQAAATARS